MKRIISYILLSVFVANLFWSSGYLLDYYVNSDFYKENCQNKDRPELKCDGKCILAQKLARSTEKGDESMPYIPIGYEYLHHFECIEFSTEENNIEHRFSWKNSYINPFDAGLLKPPG